jgi:rubrerythrin
MEVLYCMWLIYDPIFRYAKFNRCRWACYHIKTAAKTLQMAIDGETCKYTDMYPVFARRCKAVT